MSLDPAPLMQKLAEFVDDLEKDYGPDAVLEDGVIFVEVRYDDQDGDACSTVEGRSVTGRNTAAVGITYRGLKALTD